jgi:phenylacetate-coenzyme A ligase PaaK-like adenylate-forming protein
LRRVQEFEAELTSSPSGWKQDVLPDWLHDFVETCFRDVPFYRRYGARPESFDAIPTIDRADLSRDVVSFVPDTLPVDEIIVYSTSSTTGHPVVLPSHPVVAGCYLSLVKRALSRRGVTLSSKRGQVACVMIGFQQKCFTYASVNPLVDDAGFVKINLHPGDWRHPEDRAKFIDACEPEFISGDPLSFAELARLGVKCRPKALISTSMTLLDALRHALENSFGCPVLDIYSTNESGPIGVDIEGGHIPVQPKLYIEILDAQRSRCPINTRGEITLTGGFNPYLPLLRYRTGDYASLSFDGDQPLLCGLEGRPPVMFRRMDGKWINNIDVTHALKPFAIPQFTLHQAADGSLLLRMRASYSSDQQIRNGLFALFGTDQRITIDNKATFSDKVIQYTTELSP